MPRLDESRAALIAALSDRYGPLPGPGDVAPAAGETTPFEALARVAVHLVADVRTAARTLDALRAADLLRPTTFAAATPADLDDLLRDARIKLAAKALRPLQKLAAWASERNDREVADASTSTSTEGLREAWRSINGIGQATADSLLLFGFGRATYPVDRATYRILLRHGWLDPSADYDEARAVAESLAPDRPHDLAQLSLGFEKLGRDFCKPAAPRCEHCPLRPFLPEGGAIEAD